MEANGLKQKDLVRIFETASVVSEVLNGKRELTKEHIKRLNERFSASPELFFYRSEDLGQRFLAAFCGLLDAPQRPPEPPQGYS